MARAIAAIAPINFEMDVLGILEQNLGNQLGLLVELSAIPSHIQHFDIENIPCS